MIFRSPKKNPILAWSSKFPESEQDDAPPSPEALADLVQGLTTPGLKSIETGRTYWLRLPGFIRRHKVRLIAETGKLSGSLRFRIRGFGLRPPADLTLLWQRKDTASENIHLELSSNGGFRTNTRLDAFRHILLWRFMVKLAGRLRGKTILARGVAWRERIRLLVLQWRLRLTPAGPILLVAGANNEPPPKDWVYLNDENRYNERLYIFPLARRGIGFSAVFVRPDQGKIELMKPWRHLALTDTAPASWHSDGDFFYIKVGLAEFRPTLKATVPEVWRPSVLSQKQDIFSQIRSIAGRAVLFGQKTELSLAFPVNKAYSIENDDTLRGLVDALELPGQNLDAYLIFSGRLRLH